MSEEPRKPKNQRDWVEEMEVAGSELVERVKAIWWRRAMCAA